MDWKKVYQLPFKSDEIGYVWANNGTMTLMFGYDCETFEEMNFIKKVVDKLNGDSSIKFDSNFEMKDSIVFYYDNEYSFCVRGWGCLTGVGGYNLSDEEATKTQNEFVNWILETLNS